MAAQTQNVTDSIYEAIAALRWPGFEISGAGSIAVILHCSRKVILITLPMEAQSIQVERCGATCQREDRSQRFHRIEELSIPKPRQFTFRNLPED